MSDRDYDVGRGRPPKGTQFKKGASGNPKGRPKGSTNFNKALNKELRQKIEIREGGKKRSVSKQEALVKQTVNKAIEGDARHTSMVVANIQKLEAVEGSRAQVDLDEKRMAILRRHEERLKAEVEVKLREEMAQARRAEEEDCDAH